MTQNVYRLFTLVHYKCNLKVIKIQNSKGIMDEDILGIPFISMTPKLSIQAKI